MATPVITSPILRQAYDHDWYFPWSVPADVAEHELYQTAVREGWHEWIESPLDWQAVLHGFVYDQSLDLDGRPAYWFEGEWHLSGGEIINVADEAYHIGHVGRGDHFMRFCETFLRHTKNNACNNELVGKDYRFLPFHRKVVAGLFGWVHRDNRLRRYQNLYLTIGKKGGKSALMSTLAVYMLMADGTPKAQVYSCACDRNQARIIYEEAAHMVKGSGPISDHVTVVDSRSRLVHQSSGSFYVVLSADAHRNDGIDSSCTLVDEIHRHPNRKLCAVMQRAGLARREPLMATITTYGPSLSDGSIWAEIHTEAKQQLEGNRPDSWRNMAVIASAEPIPVTATATVPEGATRIPVLRLQQPVDVSRITFDASQIDDNEEENKIEVEVVEPAKRFQDYLIVAPVEKEIPQFSEATANMEWRTDHAIRRANPSVDIVTPLERIRQDIEESRTPEREAETRQLSLNIVSGSGRKWLSTAAWNACNKNQVQPKHLVGRQCFGGFDLSFGNDLTAFSLAFPSWDISEMKFEEVDKPRIDLLTWAWTPIANIEEREELEQFAYRHYAKQTYLIEGKGPIRFCEGSVIDFGQVSSEIIEICGLFEVTGIGYDVRFGSFVVPRLEEEGITCVVQKQGAYMSPSCKRFSECVCKGQLAHGSNPVLDRAVEGAVLNPPDKHGNTYLVKGKSHTRIDPLIAAVIAVGFATNPPVMADGAWSDASAGTWG